MPAARSSRVLATVSITLCALWGAAFVAPAGAQVTPGDEPVPPAEPAVTAAEAELADVRELFDSGVAEPDAPAPTAEEGTDATLELRDLALVLDDLDADDRAEAQRYLARPTEPDGPGNFDRSYSVPEAPPVCYGAICIHYVASSNDAPPMADGPDANTTPDYIDTVLDITVKARNTYLAAGYRGPKSDGARGGGTGITDFYIADIGDQRIYGYCPSEDKLSPQGPYNSAAYCVLDDDYAPSEFPTNTPLQNLQVTVAHEYFHVVQYAYDALEDSWFLEATAAWAEDELYDAVDDNAQYLPHSPLRSPRTPLDTFESSGTFHYGTWIFFRYLSERFPTSQGGLPTIVRDMFVRADGAPGGDDQYSMQAVASALKARGTSLPSIFAKFSAANRRPAQTYSEGRANRYRPAPLQRSLQLGRGQSRSGTVRADHLTSATVRFTPAADVRGKLRLVLDMAAAKRGSAAVASITLRSGKVRVVPIRIKASGAGAKTVPFSPREVKHVELTLANAGIRYTCFNAGPFSCQGTSRDDNATERYRATVVGG